MPGLHISLLCMQDMSEKTSSPQKEKSLYVKMPQAESKGLKRKLLIPASPTEEHDGEKKSSTSKRKRNSLTLESSPEPSNNNNAASPRNSCSNPSRTVPLSERQQMAMLMRLSETAQGDASPKPTSPTSTVSSTRKTTPAEKEKNKVNKRNERGETQLHIAAKRGDIKHMKKLIKNSAEINVADYAGWTALHEACNRGHLLVARQLLRAGSNVNVRGCDDETPLHDAAMNGHKELVELLLKHGANPLQMNRKGKTPLDVAQSVEIEQLMRKEIIASSCSESSSMDEARSPTSPSSASSVVPEDHTQDSSEGDLLTRPDGKLRATAAGKLEELSPCLSSRRNLLGREAERTNSSPRLCFKLSSSKQARDSKDPQVRSYIVLPGGKKESPPNMSSPISSDSDQFQDHFMPCRQQLQKEEDKEEDMETDRDAEVSRFGRSLMSRMTDNSLNMHHKEGGGVGDEAEAPSSQNYLKTLGKFPCSHQVEHTNDSIIPYGRSLLPRTQAVVLDRTAGVGVKGSLGESQHIPDQSDANHHRRPLTFSPSSSSSSSPSSTSSSSSSPPQAAAAASTSTSSAFRDCGAPDSTNSSSTLASYQFGSGSGSSSTGTNGHTGAVPTVSSSSSLSPSPSAHTHRVGRTSPYHPPQKQPRLAGVASNGPTGPDRSPCQHGPSPSSRWDLRESRSGSWGGDDEDVSAGVSSHRERTDSGGQSSISPRTERLSRESQRGGDLPSSSNNKDDGVSPRSELGSRPCSPKVPPLKIVLSTKSSPATSSSEPDSLKAPTKLYHVLNPTQEQGERAGKEEGEEQGEGEAPRPLLQPPLTRLMASQSSSQMSMSPASSRPPSRASQGEAEENKAKHQPQPSSSTSSSSTATTASSSSSSFSATSAALEESGKGKEERLSDKSQDQEENMSFEESDTTEKEKRDGEEKASESKEATTSSKPKEEAKEEKEERRTTRTLRSHTAQLQAQQQKLEKQEKEKQEKMEKASNSEVVQQAEAGSSSSPKGEEAEDFDNIHPRKRKLRPKTEAQALPMEPPALPPMPEKPPNPYQHFLDIRKKIALKQSCMSILPPKPPDGFSNYMMVTGNYMIQGNSRSMFSVPMLSPPNSVTGPMVEVFKKQEKARYELRCMHLIELDKLRLMMEQEILREHTRAARAMANQPVPFSFCSILRDQEIYNPEFERAEERTVRTRYTGRQLLLWLQDVKDKFTKMKQMTALRQHQEAESLYVVQRMDWEWKLKELGQCDRFSKPQIDDLQVPMVDVNDNYDLPN